jgi:hypothetical protein
MVLFKLWLSGIVPYSTVYCSDVPPRYGFTKKTFALVCSAAKSLSALLVIMKRAFSRIFLKTKWEIIYLKLYLHTHARFLLQPCIGFASDKIAPVHGLELGIMFLLLIRRYIGADQSIVTRPPSLL